MSTFFFIGFGGFLGSVARYYTGRMAYNYLSASFPFGTLAVNTLGCFLIGMIYSLSMRSTAITPGWRMFLIIGFCGGFTTFSTFSYESIQLMRDNEYLYAALNILGSVALGLLAVLGGMAVTQRL